MTRDITPIKWIIGAIALLIIIAGACYLWYRYDTAPYRQEAAETAEFARQWELTQKADTESEVEQAADAPADSTTLTAEKSVNKVTAEVKNNTKAKGQQLSEMPAEDAEANDVLMSPFGFGPYPEIPEDYPTKHLIKWPDTNPRAELLSRVLIKLWTEGEKNFHGGSTNGGKVYPHYYNTVYVRFSEYRRVDGKKVRYAAAAKSGAHVNFTEEELLNPPPHLRVLDLDSSGIDPYQYLNLPYQKGDK